VPEVAAAKLSTHALNLAGGRPAAGLKIELWRLDPAPRLLKTAATNADGRTDEPLLAGADMAVGSYQLVFFVGDYFAAQPGATEGGRFLDQVPVRFNLSGPSASYHIPLLFTPWAYSTYRGS
jgi:5-hydroxyisourate hydrolase